MLAEFPLVLPEDRTLLVLTAGISGVENILCFYRLFDEMHKPL